MARGRSVMSGPLKMEIAKELGFFSPQVAGSDFGEVSSRNCGNMVRTAIEIAGRNIAGK